MADDYDFSGLAPEGQQQGSPEPASISEQSGRPPVESRPEEEAGVNLSGLSVLDHDQANKAALEEKYGSLPQQALTVAEGAAQGVAGPLAPAFERLTGLTTGKDILGRATTNPFLHSGSEALAFGAASYFGDELGLSGVVGEAGQAATKLLPEVTGIKSAAELATLSASNELSRMVEGDPNQTLGSAAVSVGLSGVLGGLGGAFLEKYNPFKAYAANKLRSKASNIIAATLGEGASLIAGIGLGNAMGFPVLGGFIAERTLAPIFTALAKPFANKLAGTAAAEAAYDYIYTANAGQKTITNAVSSLFSKSFQSVNFKDILPPSDAERSKLESYLLKQQDPKVAIEMGNPIAHYLPEHATEAASLSAKAVNYFNSLKPVQAQTSPLDTPSPIDKSAQNKYNRALDVAQKPLLVIPHIQNGTLLPQDVVTLRTLFPGVHEAIVRNMTKEIIANPEAAKNFPYAKKQAMSVFIGGKPLESTMTPQAAQAIMHSNASQQAAESQPQAGGRRPSQSALGQVNKVNALYQTPLEARAVNRRK